MSTRNDQQSAPTAIDDRESAPGQPASPQAQPPETALHPDLLAQLRALQDWAYSAKASPAKAGPEEGIGEMPEPPVRAPSPTTAETPEPPPSPAVAEDERARQEPARVERIERRAPASAPSGQQPPIRRPAVVRSVPGAAPPAQPGRIYASQTAATPVLKARRPRQWSRARAALVVAGAPLALLLLFALWLLGPGRHRAVQAPFTVADASQEEPARRTGRAADGRQPAAGPQAESRATAGGSQPTLKELAAESSGDVAAPPPAGPDTRAPIIVELSKTARQQQRLSPLPPQTPPAQAPPAPATRPPTRAPAPAEQASQPPSTLPLPPAEAAPQTAAGAAGAPEEMDAVPAPAPGTAASPGGAGGSAGAGAPGAAAAGADLNGSWELHNTIDSTRYPTYRGLRLTYRITLRQEGTRVVGDGEKMAENGRAVPASQRTQIHVSGELVGRELRLVFTERGLWRGSGGNFRWRLSADGASLAGTFASNVADSRGSSDASRLPSSP